MDRPFQVTLISSALSSWADLRLKILNSSLKPPVGLVFPKYFPEDPQHFSQSGVSGYSLPVR